jgi:hypothetical protein
VGGKGIKKKKCVLIVKQLVKAILQTSGTFLVGKSLHFGAQTQKVKAESQVPCFILFFLRLPNTAEIS